jgi:hypothetical protein
MVPFINLIDILPSIKLKIEALKDRIEEVSDGLEESLQ